MLINLLSGGGHPPTPGLHFPIILPLLKIFLEFLSQLMTCLDYFVWQQGFILRNKFDNLKSQKKFRTMLEKKHE